MGEVRPVKVTKYGLLVETLKSEILSDYDFVSLPGRSHYDVIGINNFEAGALVVDHLLSAGQACRAGFNEEGFSKKESKKESK